MPSLRGASRATVFALSLGLAAGAVYGGPFEGVAHAQRNRPLTKKERQKRKQQEEAEKREQQKRDAEAAAAEEEERKKAAAAAAASAAAAKQPPPPPPKTEPEVPPDQAVVVSLDVGYTRPSMSMLAAGSMAFDNGSANGFLVGLNGGLRRKEWMYGLRFRTHNASTFSLWSFAGSVSYSLKPRTITPVVEGHLGYVFARSIDREVIASSVPPDTILSPAVDVKGVLLGGEGSANLVVTNWFRAGAFVGLDFMFLARGKAPLPQSATGPNTDVEELPLYTKGGFGIGLNLNVGLRGSFEIGVD